VKRTAALKQWEAASCAPIDFPKIGQLVLREGAGKTAAANQPSGS
jgi:hypothetical protein